MPRYFTHYWQNRTWDSSEATGNEGRDLDYAASNQFRRRGIRPGDLVYVVTIRGGELYVLGRMEIDRLVGRSEAERILRDDDLWEAKDYIIGRDSTPMRFGGPAPINLAHSLRFARSDGTTVALEFDDPERTRLNNQTLRGVRELSQTSAELLDEFIESREATDSDLVQAERDIEGMKAEDAPGDEGAEPEGGRKTGLVNRYERSARLRAKAIKIHGTRCQVCGFSFEEHYGQRGKDYIEVHHKRPIASYQGRISVDPRAEMAVLCSNCHRMIHRDADSPLEVEVLRRIVEARRDLRVA